MSSRPPQAKVSRRHPGAEGAQDNIPRRSPDLTDTPQRPSGAPGDPRPFDLHIRRLPPGKSVSPYRRHPTQWKLFVVPSESATVRQDGAIHQVKAGDALIHPPAVAHQVTHASATDDLVILLIANQPTLDPVSAQYGSRPLPMCFRLQEADYFAGVEEPPVVPENCNVMRYKFPPRRPAD